MQLSLSNIYGPLTKTFTHNNYDVTSLIPLWWLCEIFYRYFAIQSQHTLPLQCHHVDGPNLCGYCWWTSLFFKVHYPWVLKCGYKENILPNPLNSKGGPPRCCSPKPHELQILEDHKTRLKEGDTPLGKLLAY